MKSPADDPEKLIHDAKEQPLPGELSKLPRYSARHKRDRQTMIDWVIGVLNWEDEEFAKVFYSREYNEKVSAYDKAEFERDPDMLEIRAAWAGDIGPLQQKYPQLAPFLKAPPPRQQKKDKWRGDILDLVVRDVKRIKDLWKKHHKRTKRSVVDGASAIEIAIERWDDEFSQYRANVTVEAVEARMKPSGPSGRKRPKPKKKVSPRRKSKARGK